VTEVVPVVASTFVSAGVEQANKVVASNATKNVFFICLSLFETKIKKKLDYHNYLLDKFVPIYLIGTLCAYFLAGAAPISSK
jgi:hypothetical protein